MTNKQRQKRLLHLQLQMLRQQGWRYLRYIHLKDFVQNTRDIVTSIGVVGAGYGFAELAIAIEYPDVEFFLTDIVSQGRPNYWKCMDLCMRWDIRNVRFGVWDLMGDTPCRFDAVASTEVLEHIESADLALVNMRKAAKRAMYALTPFATSLENDNPLKRTKAFEKHEHFVCGYDFDYFQKVDPNVEVYGTYWNDFGGSLRRKLMTISPHEIEVQRDSLSALAEMDLTNQQPQRGQCLGIKAIMKF